uniref:Uncharacterized protein n=1 Tax=Chromera velia CCMP2878 TaxID=1169474 RepID=A0A0G4HV14_9ALVE|eukprot:Cvel_8759.t1-p1 / transcript=Cvel_8759.t1 / gene=Cvel_8759 / organism=Chromera_velia_CCMP2878 / gene_product=hypothetical protein / transcript_product=hypothetical protein / location=Cvel_scaffold490:6009-7554(+) / protein_length=263 / sequence_SO=supercontig / SO=protein_coding / is_pseudo=false
MQPLVLALFGLLAVSTTGLKLNLRQKGNKLLVCDFDQTISKVHVWKQSDMFLRSKPDIFSKKKEERRASLTAAQKARVDAGTFQMYRDPKAEVENYLNNPGYAAVASNVTDWIDIAFEGNTDKFGDALFGASRLAELKKFFEKAKEEGVTIAILSKGVKEFISATLKAVDLDKYFSGVYGIFEGGQDKTVGIKRVMKDLGGTRETTVFTDDDPAQIQHVCKYAQTGTIPSILPAAHCVEVNPRAGLTSEMLEQLQTILKSIDT